MDISPWPKTHTQAATSGQLSADEMQTLAQEEDVAAAPDEPLFENPFTIEDIMVFDDASMQRIFSTGGFGITLDDLALSVQGAPSALIKHIRRNLPPPQRSQFMQRLRYPCPGEQVQAARKRVLDELFWELTYWKTPDLYEELTEGERLHPGIFQRLEPDLRGKVVLDAGAGSGRASFECMHHGARIVYAVEPSPGLLRILEKKVANQPTHNRIVPYQGRFDQLPLGDASVDLALSCSAFTAEPEQGGEPGLAELKRVTRPGGKIVLIWPRQKDYDWLSAHGFQYVVLPVHQEMRVRFRSLQSAVRCAHRFYAHNRAVLRYILQRRRPEVPFSVLGLNPPRDYCWLTVE
ncbi:MAG TPA: methyltransferase domain-containing protein [Ktedonobacteraceae bacterium]|nr:methyltransferase domain-containing protein [Ktedonobacteraceae bacterium]